MKSKKFFCKDCNKCFDEPVFYEEAHGFDSPPYERVAICPFCESDDFEEFETAIEKCEVADKIMPAIMHLNRYFNGLKDIFGLDIKSCDFENAVSILIDALSEMFDFFDNRFQKEMLEMCTEYDLEKNLLRFKDL